MLMKKIPVALTGPALPELPLGFKYRMWAASRLGCTLWYFTHYP